MCENIETYEARGQSILLSLFMIWIVTIPTGLFGIWKSITIPLLFILSVGLTGLCLVNLARKKHCNFCLGICGLYFSALCLLSAYKVVYWQFQISVWWLLGAIAVTALFSLFVLWRFVKNGKKVKKTKPVYPITIALLTYPLVRIISSYVKGFNSNKIAVLIMALCLVILALLMSVGIRLLVLDDDKVIYNVKFK